MRPIPSVLMQAGLARGRALGPAVQGTLGMHAGCWLLLHPPATHLAVGRATLTLNPDGGREWCTQPVAGPIYVVPPRSLDWTDSCGHRKANNNFQYLYYIVSDVLAEEAQVAVPGCQRAARQSQLRPLRFSAALPEIWAILINAHGTQP